MSRRKIKKLVDKDVEPEVDPIITPQMQLAQRRMRQKKRYVTEVYMWIAKKEFDITRKDDYTYIVSKAAEKNWPRARLEFALREIWAEAMQDVKKEQEDDTKKDNH
jgi:hypothetical protein